MSAFSALASRVDRGAVRTFLPGDLVAVVLFLVAGAYRHGTLANPDRLVATSLPFLVGWLVVGPLAGAYAARVRSSTAWLVGAPLGAWVVTAALGVAVRATEPVPGSADPAFFLVAAGFGGGLLVAWRLLRVRFGPAPGAAADADAR